MTLRARDKHGRYRHVHHDTNRSPTPLAPLVSSTALRSMTDDVHNTAPSQMPGQSHCLAPSPAPHQTVHDLPPHLPHNLSPLYDTVPSRMAPYYRGSRSLPSTPVPPPHSTPVPLHVALNDMLNLGNTPSHGGLPPPRSIRPVSTPPTPYQRPPTPQYMQCPQTPQTPQRTPVLLSPAHIISPRHVSPARSVNSHHSHRIHSNSSDQPKTLPSVMHIPLLTSCKDFGAWVQAVEQTITNLGYYDHICDDDIGDDPARLDLSPSYPPKPLPDLATDAEHRSYSRWWEDDNRAQHVLMSRLSVCTQSYLPNGPVYSQTACNIFHLLRRGMGFDKFTHSSALFQSLLTLACHLNHIIEFINKWHEIIAQLVSARYDIPVCYIMRQFILQLPPSFEAITMITSVGLGSLDDCDLSKLYDLLDMIEMGELSRQANNHLRNLPCQRSNMPNTAAPSSATLTSMAAPATSSVTGATAQHPSHEARQNYTCTNCGMMGHTHNCCYQAGGGMAGKWPQHVMLAEVPEEDVDDQDVPAEAIGPQVDSEPPDEAPWAGLTYVPSIVNEDMPSLLAGDLYLPACEPLHSDFAYQGTTIDPVALLSLSQRFNTVLDSGCTSHIICDHSFFTTYNESGAVDVGTVNCGTLCALATGDVQIMLKFHGQD
jgi:hypothetical protein